jgi:hypothetical protein
MPLQVMSRPCCTLLWQLLTRLSCAPAIRIDSHQVVALADLSRALLCCRSPMPIDADRCAQRPVSKLPSPMPSPGSSPQCYAKRRRPHQSHAIASRFAAVRISAFQRSLAALLCAFQGPCIAPRHTVSLRITHCRIKHTRALLYICFPGLNKALPSPRVPRHLSAPAALYFASQAISLPPPRLS